MTRIRPARLRHIAGIGVDRMGAIADASRKDLLRFENLDVDIPPDPEAIAQALADADSRYQQALLNHWTARADFEKALGMDP